MAKHGSLPPKINDSSGDAEQQLGTESLMAEWVTVPVLSRVDAFSHRSLQESIEEFRRKGCHHFILDFTSSRFISVQSIRYCVETANSLYAAGGKLVLLGCSERIKKHFEVYGSLKHIQVARNEAELKKLGLSLEKRRNSEFDREASA
jgi:anti-anti-sigma factor